MKNKGDSKIWAEEFQRFLESPVLTPPARVREEIFSVVQRDLQPPLWLVLAKLGAIHVFAGSLSLHLCSQFGIGRGYNLMHVFAHWSELACMMACGSLFLGLTVFVAGFLLTPFELKKIRATAYAPLMALAALSLFVLFCFGAEIALNLAFMWLLGAVLTGALLIESRLAWRRLA